MKRTIFLLVFLLPLEIYAQQIEPGTDRFLYLTYDNDFFSGTDRYYTQGIKIELISGLR